MADLITAAMQRGARASRAAEQFADCRGGEPRLLGDILGDYLASNEPLARGYRAYQKRKEASNESL